MGSNFAGLDADGASYSRMGFSYVVSQPRWGLRATLGVDPAVTLAGMEEELRGKEQAVLDARAVLDVARAAADAADARTTDAVNAEVAAGRERKRAAAELSSSQASARTQLRLSQSTGGGSDEGGDTIAHELASVTSELVGLRGKLANAERQLAAAREAEEGAEAVLDQQRTLNSQRGEQSEQQRTDLEEAAHRRDAAEGKRNEAVKMLREAETHARMLTGCAPGRANAART
ncbi:hypothetical protein FOA52_008421 [Chlamydomonas sp. UWO 241]|nr:hypothetical protein FOA52_008421 [Chlamydomonas sp. UWO 241]